MSEPIHTYPEGTKIVVGLLKLSGSNYQLYAAERIEELEEALRTIRDQGMDAGQCRVIAINVLSEKP